MHRHLDWDIETSSKLLDKKVVSVKNDSIKSLSNEYMIIIYRVDLISIHCSICAYVSLCKFYIWNIHIFMNLALAIGFKYKVMLVANNISISMICVMDWGSCSIKIPTDNFNSANSLYS